jgi:hypothetical protein
VNNATKEIIARSAQLVHQFEANEHIHWCCMQINASHSALHGGTVPLIEFVRNAVVIDSNEIVLPYALNAMLYLHFIVTLV